jgi:hypothetical protein
MEVGRGRLDGREGGTCCVAAGVALPFDGAIATGRPLALGLAFPDAFVIDAPPVLGPRWRPRKMTRKTTAAVVSVFRNTDNPSVPVKPRSARKAIRNRPLPSHRKTRKV